MNNLLASVFATYSALLDEQATFGCDNRAALRRVRAQMTAILSRQQLAENLAMAREEMSDFEFDADINVAAMAQIHQERVAQTEYMIKIGVRVPPGCPTRQIGVAGATQKVEASTADL